MRPKDLLMATYNPKKGTVVIALTVFGGRIVVLGASCRTNAMAGECVNALTVVPEVDRKDVVALEISYADGEALPFMQRKFVCFILEVTGGAEKPVNLENEWVSSADWLATAVNSSVVVEIDGVRYIGREYPKDRYYPSGLYVDPNLLCKYLAGKTAAEEVKAAAKEFRKDEPLLSQKEQKEFCAEVERLNTALVAEYAARMAHEENEHRLIEESARRAEMIADLRRSNGDLFSLTLCLRNAALRQWFKSADLKAAIKNVDGWRE